MDTEDYVKFKTSYISKLPSDYLLNSNIKDSKSNKSNKNGSNSPIQILNKQLIDFYYKIKPEDFLIRKKAVLLLKEMLQSIITNEIDLKIFGSVGAKNYLPSSDIDVQLILKKFKFESQKESDLFLEKLAIKLEGQNLPVLFIKAKVPILKISFKKFKFDLSLYENNKNHNEIYENAYTENKKNSKNKNIDGLKIFHLLIKQYLKNRNFNVSNVVQFVLCYNFLYFYPVKVDVKKNLGILMMDFFYYFGNLLNKKGLGVLISLKDYEKSEDFCFEDPLNGEIIRFKGFYAVQQSFYHSYRVMDICLKEFMNEKKEFNCKDVDYISLWMQDDSERIRDMKK